jgi:Protein of unknown function (DUF2530)
MARAVPPLPPRLADPVPPVVVLTALSVIAVLVLLGARVFAGRELDVWFWTANAGWVIGVLGYGLVRWQRHAARGGSRSVQQVWPDGD